MLEQLKRTRDDRACNNAIIELSKGKTEALSVIYRIYGRMILSVALQMLKNPEDAEDALHEVMLHVAHHADSYRPDTNPRAWCMAITRNTALDLLRKRPPCTSVEEAGLEAVSAEHEANTLQRLRIAEAFAALSEDEQQMVKFKLYCGLSHAEIAELMHLTTDTAKKRYERALKKLRAELTKGNESL